ncbi:caspase family protein [Streptomyces sp. NPDC090493]|uniref:caspase, EACC1-associated type n=1 Tax=Streptomyces sp. NPDC090493 TaxID=3365964 RepID=UPI00380E45C7
MTTPEPPPLYDYAHSRAVLIGGWDYDHLPPVASATRNSLDRMAELLQSPLCGWPRPSGSPADRLQVLRNPRRRNNLPDDLMRWFEDAADLALIYFVGHGRLYGDELCLALAESPLSGSAQKTTGLRFSDIREALEESEAVTKVVILDCCFSGQATLPRNTLSAPAITELTHCSGAITLAATDAYRTAWFEPDSAGGYPQTHFTRYLVDAIEAGAAGHPHGVSLETAFAAASAALVRDGKPRPTQSVRHHAGRFVIAGGPARHRPLPGRPDVAPGEAAAGSGPAHQDADELFRAALALEMDWDTTAADLPRIQSMYRSAAEAGHPEAMTRLGMILEGRAQERVKGTRHGDAVTPDLDGALHWYTRAARLGSSHGAYFLGLFHEDHLGKWPEALVWYREAARDERNWAARKALAGLEDRMARGLGPLAHAGDFGKTGISAHQQEQQSQQDGESVVFSMRANEQGALVTRILAGDAGPDVVATVQANFQRWLRDVWGGDQNLAMAFCVQALAEACGGLRGEWGTLSPKDQSGLVWFFSLLCLPTRDSVDGDAAAFRDQVRDAGRRLQDLARTANTLRGQP